MKRIVFGFAIYACVMIGLAAYRWHVWSFGADTGTFVQIALHAFSGFDNTSERGSHFAVHWSPILVVLYPFAALTKSGLSIQIVQIVAIGASVFPFCAFLRRYVEPGSASTLALIALLYPPLIAVAFDEFHELAFYPVIVFALVWALDTGRRSWAIAFGISSLLIREDALLVNCAFGMVLAIAAARTPRKGARGLLFLEPRERRWSISFGVALAVSALVVFGAYFSRVAPSSGGWTASHFYRYPFANGPRELILASLTQPLTVLHAIATPGRLTYLLEAFAPVLFLSLRSPWMFVALPGFAVILLSSDASAWRMGNHYAALWAPWVLIAAAGTLIGSIRATQRVAMGVLAACAIVLIAFDPMHPNHYLRAPYADRESARRAFETVPPEASVFTHDEWFAHYAGVRPAIEHVWNEPAYAILASDFPNPQTFAPFMRLQVARGCYAVVGHVRAVIVYHRLPAAETQERCVIAR